MRADRIRSAIVAAITLVFLIACGQQPPPPMATTCGTTAAQPIAADAAHCARNEAGYRWYTARADDVDEADEIPIVDQPLDEDWYDPIAQADLDEVFEHSKPSKPSKAATPTATCKPTATRSCRR